MYKDKIAKLYNQCSVKLVYCTTSVLYNQCNVQLVYCTTSVLQNQLLNLSDLLKIYFERILHQHMFTLAYVYNQYLHEKSVKKSNLFQTIKKLSQILVGLYCSPLYYFNLIKTTQSRSMKRREIQLTRPALPYDYTCFADGYFICVRNICQMYIYRVYNNLL